MLTNIATYVGEDKNLIADLIGLIIKTGDHGNFDFTLGSGNYIEISDDGCIYCVERDELDIDTTIVPNDDFKRSVESGSLVRYQADEPTRKEPSQPTTESDVRVENKRYALKWAMSVALDDKNDPNSVNIEKVLSNAERFENFLNS